MTTNKYCSLFDKICHADFFVWRPLCVVEIKFYKIIFFIVLWPSQRSLRALPAQWNRCCTYFIGAVISYPVVYCIGRRIENFMGNSNEVWVYWIVAWELIHRLNGSEFWVQRLHLMDTALNINQNLAYPSYPIEWNGFITKWRHDPIGTSCLGFFNPERWTLNL